MGTMRIIGFTCTICVMIFFMLEGCDGNSRHVGRLYPGFQGSRMNWIDVGGVFLVSNSSTFALGFKVTSDTTLFLLVVIHMDSSTVVWTANRGTPVQTSDRFMFDEDGNAYLENEGSVVWKPDTNGVVASAIELHDSGNLALVGPDGNYIWQSFRHPTDTLLSNQEFSEGMKLVSDPSSSNLNFSLEIKSGDMALYSGFQTPQRYWTMGKENRKTVNKIGGEVTLATLDGNSWKFFDRNKTFLWQFIFSASTSPNTTSAVVLGNDGLITFSYLVTSAVASSTKIPSNPCGTPEPCDPYNVCSSNNKCRCPSGLTRYNCKTGITSPCKAPQGSIELVDAGEGLDYFALGYVGPSMEKTDLHRCKDACLRNCSCLALFFRNSSRECFMFDQIGSFQESGTPSLSSFIKISSSLASPGAVKGNSRIIYVVIIAIGTVVIIIGLIFGAFSFIRMKQKEDSESMLEAFEEDTFLDSLSGMPTRFTYRDLEIATNNFSIKLGQGGFGSVYKGKLPDGSQIAVKKLEGIGQGKKEFRSEVCIIGSIRHIHLVKLRGFCTEGTHRLLAYEYMANGSLERWIFKKREGFLLDWETRFNIALGTAKGLAYLHEDCDSKIVHCDIKPENVLLDENFHAKVSDFGLAKLMTREQSHVFTTLRGTRGYLAPEWITNYAISEKSDVYSYGMVLLEIMGGRKNFDPTMSSEKSHFPTFAFKMLEQGTLLNIFDPQLLLSQNDERVTIALKVALWCIQDDMQLRPSMSKVVQMLERVCPVSTPPTSALMVARLYSNSLKSSTDDGTTTASSGPSDLSSETFISAVRLSGPR
ncbi:unnamed protein product [Rhodiola kirilowii]